MNILNQMNGGVRDTWCCKETTGGASIVEHVQPRSTIRDMRERTLERSPSHGWYLSVILAMNLSINEQTTALKARYWCYKISIKPK